MDTTCYPPGADWGCSFGEEQLAQMREDPIVVAQMERAEALAWTMLATLTADQIGVCPVTVRPCAASCSSDGTWTTAPARGGFGSPAGRPAILNPWINQQGAWVNGCGCKSSGDCGCSALSEIILPGPVGKVEEVWLFGRALEPYEYRVDNASRLVMLIRGESWPTCQDLQQDAHGEDAFSVTYYRGAAPSAPVLVAVGALAGEIYKDCIGAPCALPAGLRSISRDGITADFEAPDGLTGIREVDIVIQRLNPHLLKTRPRISSPDYRPFDRQTR